MLEVRLGLATKAGDPLETTTATFDETEIDLRRRYVEFVDRLRVTTLLQRGMPAITNMSWKLDEGMKWTCPPYENSELHELLHVLRPLILSKEATSFEHIAGLLGRKFDSDKFRRHLKLQRTIFEDGELRLYMQISLNDQPLLDDATLKLWLNGEQYHTDEEKAATWKEIEEGLTVENTRALVITQLQAKVKALFNVQYIASLILGKAGAQPGVAGELRNKGPARLPELERRRAMTTYRKLNSGHREFPINRAVLLDNEPCVYCKDIRGQTTDFGAPGTGLFSRSNKPGSN